MHVPLTRTILSVALLIATTQAQSSQSKTPSASVIKHVTVTLINGDVISGDLTAESVDSLTIHSEILGELIVPRAKTSPSVNDSASAIQKQQAADILQQNSVASSSPQKPSISASNNVVVPSNKLVVAKLKIGAGLLLSTQKQQTYSGELDLVKSWNAADKGWPHQRSLLLLSPSYDDKRSSKGVNITRNYNGIFQHLLFTSNESLYVPVFANLYSNNSLGIYLQQAYGAGIGKTLGALEVNADLRFIGEHFLQPASPNPPIKSLALVGAGLSERYDFPLTALKPGAKLTETIEFVPVFNESSAWQGHGIIELSIPFTKQLSFVVSAFDNYVENAPPTFRKNYFKSTIGIQYSSPSTKK